MSIRLLLADDHAVVRNGLRALLEKEGFQVSAEASDGQEAVRLAAVVHPDIAVLDISMPLLNGLDAARELKKNEEGIKIVLLTSLLPIYLQDHLHFGGKVTDWLTGLPLFCGAFSCVLGGFLSDWLIRRTGSRSRGRRLVGVATLVLAGLSCLLPLWTGEVWLLAVALGAWLPAPLRLGLESFLAMLGLGDWLLTLVGAS